MKRNLFSVLIAVIFLATATLTAQQKQESTLKKEIKSLKEQKHELTRQERKAKKQLRKLEAQEVEGFVKQQFAEDFPKVKTTKWTRYNLYDIAEFTQNGVVVKAYYDNQPELVGTITEMKFADLPAKAQKEIEKKFAGYVKNAVLLFEDNEYNDADIIIYDEPFTGPDTYFVELSKEGKKILVGVSEFGDLVFYKDL